MASFISYKLYCNYTGNILNIKELVFFPKTLHPNDYFQALVSPFLCSQLIYAGVKVKTKLNLL